MSQLASIQPSGPLSVGTPSWSRGCSGSRLLDLRACILAAESYALRVVGGGVAAGSVCISGH
eukprot:3310556-Amphidinium_carterae.1